ncbi:MAG: hypothetical protein ACREM1_14080, partial [Longimicrobiales bacterium]
VSATPTFRLGTADGGGPEDFGQVAGVVELSDGTIIVADGLARELRAFDRSGTQLWRTGGAGPGPGELRALSAIALLPGDSILAAEFLQASVFGPAGTYQRRFSRDPFPAGRGDVTIPSVQGGLSDGTLLETTMLGGSPEADLPERPQVVAAFRDPEGRVLHEISESFLGPARYVVVSPEQTGQGIEVQTATGDMGPETVFAVGSDWVAAGIQESFEIRRYRSDGSLFAILRVAHAPPSVDKSRYVQHGLSDIDDPGRRAEVRKQREEAFLPETLPLFATIHVDLEERLWIQEFVPVYERRLPVWWVVGPGGEFLAEATLPERFIPYRISSEEVLGVTLDPLDVPHVEVYRIGSDSG